jgi:hypothetical protein
MFRRKYTTQNTCKTDLNIVSLQSHPEGINAARSILTKLSITNAKNYGKQEKPLKQPHTSVCIQKNSEAASADTASTNHLKTHNIQSFMEKKSY